jgi:hypothetical protein
MPRIRTRLDLLQHSLPRQPQVFFLTEGGSLRRTQLRIVLRLVIGLRLLGFNRFALPSPSHFVIIVPGLAPALHRNKNQTTGRSGKRSLAAVESCSKKRMTEKIALHFLTLWL